MNDRDKQNFLNQMCRNMNLSMRMGLELDTGEVANQTTKAVGGPIHYSSLSSLSASMNEANMNQSYKSEKTSASPLVNPFVNPYHNAAQPKITRAPGNFQNLPSVNNFAQIQNMQSMQNMIPSNINQPYTMNKINANNFGNFPNNFYNPLIVQNYYAMYNQNRNNCTINAPYFNPSYTNNKSYTNPMTTNMTMIQTPPGLKNYQHNHNFNKNTHYMNYSNSRQNSIRNNNNNYNNHTYNNNYNTFNNNTHHDKYRHNDTNYESLISDHQDSLAGQRNSAEITKEDQEEIKKWVEARKRNFPSNNRINEKNEIGKKKEELGMISELEKKLREKIKIMRTLDKGGYHMKDRGKYKNRSNRRKKKRRNFNKSNEAPEEGEIVEVKSAQCDFQDSIKIGDTEKNKFDFHISESDEMFLQKRKRCENPNKEENKSDQIIRKNNNRVGFRYKKSFIYENLIRSDKIREMNIILQAFRYFVKENLV
jgi:hypothetical protein